jgi:hypothetical protein
MKKSLNIVFFLIFQSIAFAQTEPKTQFNIEGQIAITTNGQGIFYNMGGPNVKFNFSKVSLAINMMPSLRFQNDPVKSVVTPMLGFGPQLYFLKNKKFLLSFPAYYNTSNNQWIFTAGVGYVLTKKK